MSLSLNIIGAGHLGKTIGALLVKSKAVTIGAVCNLSKASTIEAIEFIGQGAYCEQISELPSADITLITTADDSIALACEQLSNSPLLQSGSTIVHCSGSLSSDVLRSVKKRACFVASVHPMRSFAHPVLSMKEYSGTYCAIEGDSEALTQVQALFHSIGSITYEINKDKKSLYHAAGVFSSNYMLLLAQQALFCLKESGVEQELAVHIIVNLMRGTLSNIEATSCPKKSLTGPIKRADTATITRHLNAMMSQEQRALYALLGESTLDLTEHSTDTKEQITLALRGMSTPSFTIKKSAH